MAIGPNNPQDNAFYHPIDRMIPGSMPGPLYIPPVPPKRDWATGWLCPRCSTVHAPFVASCECRPAVDLGARLC